MNVENSIKALSIIFEINMSSMAAFNNDVFFSRFKDILQIGVFDKFQNILRLDFTVSIP